MRYRFSLASLFFVVMLLVPMAEAVADTNKLPQVMVGQTTMTQIGKTYYGGFTGNEAIFNYSPDVLLGFMNLPGYGLPDCINVYDSIIPSYAWDTIICHQLGLNGSADPYGDDLGVANLHSKTWVDSHVVLQTAALFNKPRTIIGDTYGTLQNFYTWGQNLSQVSTGNPYDTSPWRVKSYRLNSDAQSSWPGSEFAKYSDKIDRLKGEATVITDDLTEPRSWYLQGTNSLPYDPSMGDATMYPEGKAWYHDGTLTIREARTIRYKGKGTIIVNGDLNIWDGGNIVPLGSGDTLGFIVLGNVNFWSNSTIEAAIFCKNTINSDNDSKNMDFIGSFVAQNFNIKNNPSKNYNIRFNYDFNLSKDWPPGFRSIDMPREGS